MNEFYEELAKHWKVKRAAKQRSKPVVVNLDEEEEETDLSNIFEVKGECEESEEDLFGSPLEEDPYLVPAAIQNEVGGQDQADAREQVDMRPAAVHKPDLKQAVSPAALTKVPFTPSPVSTSMSSKEIDERIARLKLPVLFLFLMIDILTMWFGEVVLSE